jgi:acyl-CoA synthetase (AMP-forming)/AMP-acid ligase II
MDFTRPADADPAHLLDLIQRFGVTSLFASPALLGNLSRHLAKHSLKLPGIRRVISAGAPARHDEIAALLPALDPETKIYTPYGATEALPLCCLDQQELLETASESNKGHGICIGQPVAGATIRICELDALPTPENHVVGTSPGEIWASGTMVSRSYLHDTAANQFHKQQDENGILWHRTGDLGSFDSDGRVWFRGRLGQMVRTDKGNLHTVAIERVFDVHPGVRRSALVGIGPAGSQTPVLCIEPAQDHISDRTSLIEELRQIGSSVEGANRIERFCFPGPFPVDIRHNAKIDRKKLAQAAARSLE